MLRCHAGIRQPLLLPPREPPLQPPEGRERKEAAEKTARELGHKYASAQAEFAKMMAEKDEVSERARLALEAKHSAELARQKEAAARWSKWRGPARLNATAYTCLRENSAPAGSST